VRQGLQAASDQHDFVVSVIAQNQRLLAVLREAQKTTGVTDEPAASGGSGGGGSTKSKTKTKRAAAQGPSTRLLILAVVACVATFGMLWFCLSLKL
jgi:cobalamin biosynthesis Mg chelatase CobN